MKVDCFVPCTPAIASPGLALSSGGRNKKESPETKKLSHSDAKSLMRQSFYDHFSMY
jgi:hypothetical protein